MIPRSSIADPPTARSAQPTLESSAISHRLLALVYSCGMHTISLDELRRLAQRGCAECGGHGGHDKHDALELSGRCHPGAGVKVDLSREGSLLLRCITCAAHVVALSLVEQNDIQGRVMFGGLEGRIRPKCHPDAGIRVRFFSENVTLEGSCTTCGIDLFSILPSSSIPVVLRDSSAKPS